MLAALLQRVRGGREHASTPVFDGALRPNQDLDLCRLVGRELGPVDDVAIINDSEAALSAGNRIISLSGHWFAPATSVLAVFEGRCGALAALDDGGLAVAVDGKEIRFLGGGSDGHSIREAAGRPFACITAMAIAGDALCVAEGSATNGVTAWRRDLFERNSTGRVTRVDLASGASELVADGLAWAGGVAITRAGDVVVSESWAYSVRSVAGKALAYENIPAYPGRIVPAGDGGFWLSCLAARTQLVDFVLADRRLSERMMREIDEAFWIAPSLSATDHLYEPTQIGGVKQYGAKKPWAPARSYGLVVRLDADLAPTASLHSRVDGKRHGITGLACAGGRLFIVSRGNEKLLMRDEAEEWTQ